MRHRYEELVMDQKKLSSVHESLWFQRNYDENKKKKKVRRLRISIYLNFFFHSYSVDGEVGVKMRSMNVVKRRDGGGTTCEGASNNDTIGSVIVEEIDPTS
jgi:hypothetical protein